MLGDAWGRATYVSRRSTGFSPNVDVYYCGDPQRAVVKVDLAGVELAEVRIEVSGRQLAIVGERPVQETEGRVYQQVEIPSGPFRRVVELQVDVDAERRQGHLRGRHPADRPAAARSRRDHPPGPDQDARADGGRAGPRGGRVPARRRGRDPRRRAAARRAAGAAAARDGHLPGDAHPAGGRAGALDQAGRRRARRQPDAGDGRLARPRERGARARTTSTTSASSASSPACSRSPTARSASSSRGPSGSGSAPTSPRSPTWSRGSPSCPTWSSRAPSWRR